MKGGRTGTLHIRLCPGAGFSIEEPKLQEIISMRSHVPLQYGTTPDLIIILKVFSK